MPLVSIEQTAATRSFKTRPEAAPDRGRRVPRQSAKDRSHDRERIRHLEIENRSLRSQLRELQALSAQPSPAPALTQDRPLRGHQFGVQLIAMCIELAKRIGFRSTEFVVKLVFQTLGVNLKVPSHDAVQQWTMRLGVAELAETFKSNQRVLWMADHSSQIGKEKVLVIVGMLVDDLPPPGQTLELEKLKVLAIVPGKRWKKDDVEREYRRLAEKIGPPTYLLCDGAVELRHPAEELVRDGKKVVVLRDLKHHAANLLEKWVGRSERFNAFVTFVGLTRNRVQQTELSHFMPPPLKQKSRFMNLASLLRWSAMVLHHLDHPESNSRRGVTPERIEQKLGWLRDFADELSQWRACQEVIDKALSWINRQGLVHDSSSQLSELLVAWLEHAKEESTLAADVAKKLVAFVAEAEEQIAEGERAWLSTEVLESLLGRFKQMERQHSKGGYTRLLAALPTLCVKADAARVRSRFATTQAKDVTQWIRATLPTTLTARRNAAYQEAFTSG